MQLSKDKMKKEIKKNNLEIQSNYLGSTSSIDGNPNH